MLDLHNLKIEKTIPLVANPFSKHRDDLILAKRLEDLSVSDGEVGGATDVLASPTNTVSSNTSPVVDTYATLSCCGTMYKQKGRFLSHCRKKHGDETLVCKVCQSIFNDQKALARHEKVHKK